MIQFHGTMGSYNDMTFGVEKTASLNLLFVEITD